MNDMQIIDNSLTEIDEYHLTPSEEKLLQVLLNPHNVGKSVTDKCKLADISRTAYYEIIKRPEFIQLRNKTIIDLIQDYIPDVLSASVDVAITGGAKGYQDRRMLLEMFNVVVKENDSKITIINVGSQ